MLTGLASQHLNDTFHTAFGSNEHALEGGRYGDVHGDAIRVDTHLVTH